MSKAYDFIVVGAGIVGLTTAKGLSELFPEARIALLEKESTFGKHSSGRNSGVLHAGIYYGSDTLKAQVCASGNKAMKAYAAAKGIPVIKSGKVIVAQTAESLPQIDILENRAKANCIRVERLDERDLKGIEPYAHSFGSALYSPDTAVIDPKAVLGELLKDLAVIGVSIYFDSQVIHINQQKKVITTNNETYCYGHLINCAGAYSDRIAHQFDICRHLSIVPFKGMYYKLSRNKNQWVRGNIYPAPDLRFPFLGIHLTRGVDGEVYIGPTAMPVLGREHYSGLHGIKFRETASILYNFMRLYYRDNNNFRNLVKNELSKYNKKSFLHDVQALVPGIVEEDLIPCPKVGIRPQLLNTSAWSLEMDFIIESADNSTHVLNSISPAFTGAFAFAELIVDRVNKKAESRSGNV